MIFGGGENQLTLIKAAKNLDVKSIVIDPKADAPGKEIADHFEVVGASDYELTKKIALKYKVDGIVTGQMENPLMLMSRLAEELGYIFPSEEVVRNCRNKDLMRNVFLKNGIPCAKGILIKSEESLNPEKLKDFSFPVIIKPVDAWSSRGVYKVNDYYELEKFEKQTRSFSSDHSFLIEEFIDGKEYSVESLTCKGKTSVIQITEKILTPYPYTVEIGHIQPAELTAREKITVEETIKTTIRALGIANSATHTELKITKNGPVVIEIGARLGGDYIASYLTLASTGVNMDEGAINIALGHEPEIVQKVNGFSYIKYIELPQGKEVIKIDDWKHIRELPGVVYASVNLKKGQVIPYLTDSAKRSGFVIVKGNTREEIIHKADSFCKQLIKYLVLN